MDLDKKVIELKNINLKLGDKQVLKNVSITFENGKIYIVYGKSGSGKTTLLNVLNILYKPDKGEYYFQRQKVNYENVEMIDRFREQVGYFHQELALIESITVRENLELFAKIKSCEIDKDLLNQALKLLDIQELYETNVSKLSGGERQRAAFVKLLVFDYKVILVDEPTNNLDSENIKYMMEALRILKKHNRVVIIVTHSEELHVIADEIIRLENINEKQYISV